MPITLDRASALCFLVSGLSSRELKNLEIFLRSASGRESIFLIIASLSIIGILFSESIRYFLFPAIKTCRVGHSSICEWSLSRPLKRNCIGLEIPGLVLLVMLTHAKKCIGSMRYFNLALLGRARPAPCSFPPALARARPTAPGPCHAGQAPRPWRGLWPDRKATLYRQLPGRQLYFIICSL